jgi:hypothetical protein
LNRVTLEKVHLWCVLHCSHKSSSLTASHISIFEFIHGQNCSFLMWCTMLKQATHVHFQVMWTIIQNVCSTNCLLCDVLLSLMLRQFDCYASTILNRTSMRIVHRWCCVQLSFELCCVNYLSNNILTQSLFDEFIYCGGSESVSTIYHLITLEKCNWTKHSYKLSSDNVMFDIISDFYHWTQFFEICQQIFNRKHFISTSSSQYFAESAIQIELFNLLEQTHRRSKHFLYHSILVSNTTTLVQSELYNKIVYWSTCSIFKSLCHIP